MTRLLPDGCRFWAGDQHFRGGGGRSNSLIVRPSVAHTSIGRLHLVRRSLSPDIWPEITRWHVYFPSVVIRFGAVALLAFGLQLVAIYVPLGASDVPRRAIFIVSCLLLLLFILYNLRRPGLVILGTGLLLNFLAIVSNGGLMPVSPDTLGQLGLSPNEISLGDRVPGTKGVLLAREDTRLWFLTDTLVWKNPAGTGAFSIGDVIIAAGLVVTLGELLLPRIRRVGQPDRSSHYPSLP